MWIGLAARDSLRLEAGLCLHGQDITAETDPASAGLMWAIPKEVRAAGAFIGADALQRRSSQRARRKARRPEAGRPPAGARRHRSDRRRRQAGRPRHLRRLRPVGRPPGRHGLRLRAARQARHADFSPTCAATKIPVDVHPLPFTPHRYRKG